MGLVLDGEEIIVRQNFTHLVFSCTFEHLAGRKTAS